MPIPLQRSTFDELAVKSDTEALSRNDISLEIYDNRARVVDSDVPGTYSWCSRFTKLENSHHIDESD